MSPRLNSWVALPVIALAAQTSEPSRWIGGAATLLFAAVFVGTIAFVLVREALRLRREEANENPRMVTVHEDPHMVTVLDLGATMADGGEPTGDEKKLHPR